MADLGTLMAKLGVDTRELTKAEAHVRTFGSKVSSVFGQIKDKVFSLQCLQHLLLNFPFLIPTHLGCPHFSQGTKISIPQ